MNEEIKKQTIGEVKVTNKKSRERNKNIVLGRENKLREDNIALIRKEAYLQGAKDAIEAVKINGETSDGYHTFNELYEFRKLYNACLFNEWANQGKYKVHKSQHHSDAPYEPIFGGGWFIVTAELPTGQISNHYKMEDWELFKIPEVPVAHAWDGHTAQDVAKRLSDYLQEKPQ